MQVFNFFYIFSSVDGSIFKIFNETHVHFKNTKSHLSKKVLSIKNIKNSKIWKWKITAFNMMLLSQKSPMCKHCTLQSSEGLFNFFLCKTCTLQQPNLLFKMFRTKLAHCIISILLFCKECFWLCHLTHFYTCSSMPYNLEKLWLSCKVCMLTIVQLHLRLKFPKPVKCKPCNYASFVTFQVFFTLQTL